MHDDPANSCTFCRLIHERSADFVIEQDHAVAWVPLPDSVIAPGQTLVVPRDHTETGVLDASDEAIVATARLVQLVGQAMTAVLGATGVCVLNASGPGSGRSQDHLHWHVVPRFPGDPEDTLPWPTGRSPFVVDGDPYDLLREKLRS